ncbi:MAG TPA: GNAT family N-acetyltransferase [Acidimicrobiales bacterium]|nr:GNAT family N-acetyltransferase [Acidimicrobiales bacterium]
MSVIALRALGDDDLDAVFSMMRDPVAVTLAAFSAADPDDRTAFDAHMDAVRRSPDNLLRAVTSDGAFVGTVASFASEGHREVTYWIDRRYWGQGIATHSLALLLEEDHTRPIRARVASDNVASRRVLEKSGFTPIGTEFSYAPGRSREIDETILELR